MVETISSEQQLLATSQIQRLLFDYAYYLDMNQVDELSALFMPDCVVRYGPDFGAEGREAYAKTLEGVGSYFKATSHHVSNVAVDFESPTVARVRSVLYAWHQYRRDRPDGHHFGQYHDVVHFVDGQWMFKERELRTTGHVDFHVKELIPIGRA